LVITLLNIAADLDHAIFDLFWHYNKQARKNLFIDASCIVFQKNQSQPTCLVDIDQETAFGGSIKHSGDDLDRIECIGHHCIEVKFKHLPKDVTHLYFVLSAWNAPNMRDYFTSMALNFFDARDIFHPLCNTELQREKLGKQAVIMCYAVCTNDLWQIIEAKIPCGGNVDDYGQIKAQVAQIHKTM
jgi:stress response protein SCP2